MGFVRVVVLMDMARRRRVVGRINVDDEQASLRRVDKTGRTILEHLEGAERIFPDAADPTRNAPPGEERCALERCWRRIESLLEADWAAQWSVVGGGLEWHVELC